MRATLTRYSVPGWGDGELWMLGRVVLAHDFSFRDSFRDGYGEVAGGEALGARPPEGAASPPTGTLAAASSHGGHASVSIQRQPPLPSQCRPAVSMQRESTAPIRHQPNGNEGSAAVAHELVARLTEFLEGADVRLGDVELDLSWATPFQCSVADALRSIPRGEVVTYGELAALAGRPGAARAVGSFCAQNRFAFLVPCHRVVGASGIGGYGATGLGVKRRLLALEGVVL